MKNDMSKNNSNNIDDIVKLVEFFNDGDCWDVSTLIQRKMFDNYKQSSQNTQNVYYWKHGLVNGKESLLLTFAIYSKNYKLFTQVQKRCSSIVDYFDDHCIPNEYRDHISGELVTITSENFHLINYTDSENG